MIGSVANYYKLHEWQPGAAIVVRARVNETPDAALTDDITPRTKIKTSNQPDVPPNA